MSVDIGERIRALRTARGLSQEEVARRTGIGLKSYGDLERGRTKDPHYSTLRGVARALEVRVEELLEEDPATPFSGLGTGPEEAPERTPELDVELTNLWKSLAKRAGTLKQRYRQEITYEELIEDLARLSEDHQYLERLRRAREGAPRAYHMEPDELADAIDDVLAEENAIWAMLEHDLAAPEWAKQEARRFRQAV
jgi:transcriptional regulator with XRE-family HTH domain